MIQDRQHLPADSLWVYGYELVPPVLRNRLVGIQGILDHEHADAQHGGRIWEGRFVNGQSITHILVVSSSPAQDLDVNHRLETELARIGTGFAVTAPLEVERAP